MNTGSYIDYIKSATPITNGLSWTSYYPLNVEDVANIAESRYEGRRIGDEIRNYFSNKENVRRIYQQMTSELGFDKSIKEQTEKNFDAPPLDSLEELFEKGMMFD